MCGCGEEDACLLIADGGCTEALHRDQQDSPSNSAPVCVARQEPRLIGCPARGVSPKVRCHWLTGAHGRVRYCMHFGGAAKYHLRSR